MVASPLKYHGGKAYLAKPIAKMVRSSGCSRYCETHCGSAKVLFALDPNGMSEFINDIDSNLTNFWDVLANEHCFARFVRAVEAIPLSRAAFEQACLGNGFPRWSSVPMIAKAVEFFVKCRQSRQALGKSFCTPTSRTRRGMNENVSAWLSAVDGLPEVHARLRRVEIRNQDAPRFIRELDSDDTIFYVDPVYPRETRVTGGEYGPYEMTDEQHETLLHHLHRIKGKFLLSGYRNKMYDDFAAVAGWRRVDIEIDCKSSSAAIKPSRIESIWANYEIQTGSLRRARVRSKDPGVRPSEPQEPAR